MGTSFGLDELANWGPVVWFADVNYPQLFRMDLSTGDRVVVADAGRNGNIADVATNGTDLVWGEFTPRVGAHGRWRVQRSALDSGPTHLVDEVLEPRGGLAAAEMAIDVEGDFLAYVVPRPTPDAPLANEIVLRRLSTGEVVRRVPTELMVYDVAVGEGVVLYSEGLMNLESYGEFYDTRLMLSSDARPTPRFLFNHSYEIDIAGQRVVWQDYPDNLASGPVTAQVVISATLPDLEPVRLSLPYDIPGVGGSFLSTAGEGFVAWSQGGEGTFGLTVWRESTGTAVAVADSYIPTQTSIGGGWLAWDSYIDSGDREMFPLSAVSLQDVAQLFP
jgi:hypothetical protein